MSFRNALIAVALLLTGGFFLINWQVLAAPAKFSLLVTSVDMSVGAAMLAAIVGIVAVLALYAALWHRSLLVEYRRQAKDLQLQRTLADSAEASRLTEISRVLREDIATLATRMETALDGVRKELQATENSLAAALGEMDDRFRREGTSG